MTGKVLVLYISILNFLDKTLEDKGSLTEG